GIVSCGGRPMSERSPEHEAPERGAEPENEAPADVRRRKQGAAVLDQPNRLVGECREGRIGADAPGGQRQAQRGRRSVVLQPPEQQAQDEASRQVDDQGPERERGACASRNPRCEQIAGNRSDEAAHADPEDRLHGPSGGLRVAAAADNDSSRRSSASTASRPCAWWARASAEARSAQRTTPCIWGSMYASSRRRLSRACAISALVTRWALVTMSRSR